VGSLTRLLRDAKRPGFDWGFSGEVGTRPEWYECACCPPNVIRLVASLGHYFATANTRLSAPAIQIHQYGSLEMQLDLPGGSAFLRMQTNYPWDGGILIDIQRVPVGLTWSLELRRPGWAPGHTLSVNGAPIECEPDECGYLRLGRDWQPGDRVELSLPLGPYLVESHPHVDATRGCAAIQLGPLVYRLEARDQPSGVNLLDVAIDLHSPLRTSWHPYELGGVLAVHASGYHLPPSAWQAPGTFAANGAPFHCENSYLTLPAVYAIMIIIR
jgi:hypothetical protein